MASWASKLLGMLSLCTNRDLVQNGTWSFHGLSNHKHNLWKGCPSTDSFAQSDRYYAEERLKFMCDDKAYRKAAFQAPGCALLRFEESIQLLHGANITIAYVGDSLITQLYMSALCTAEMYLLTKFEHFTHEHDLFLRNDLPCDDQCSNATFRSLQSGLKNPCWNCGDGIKKSYRFYMDNPNLWHHQVVANKTSALVIGTGAWYNSYQGLINSTSTYAETMQRLGPVLERLRTNHNIEVFWLGLPPHNVDRKQMKETDYGYEWIHFEEKNAIAKSILEPFGVTFIDTHALLHRRKRLDPYISADGLHWCNPGLDAVPTFLNRVIFHLLAVSKGLVQHAHASNIQ